MEKLRSLWPRYHLEWALIKALSGKNCVEIYSYTFFDKNFVKATFMYYFFSDSLYIGVLLKMWPDTIKNRVELAEMVNPPNAEFTIQDKNVKQ